MGEFVKNACSVSYVLRLDLSEKNVIFCLREVKSVLVLHPLLRGKHPIKSCVLRDTELIAFYGV